MAAIMQLPVELRVKIYGHLLPSSIRGLRPIFIKKNGFCDSATPRHLESCSGDAGSLLSVSRQIQQEIKDEIRKVTHYRLTVHLDLTDRPDAPGGVDYSMTSTPLMHFIPRDCTKLHLKVMFDAGDHTGVTHSFDPSSGKFSLVAPKWDIHPAIFRLFRDLKATKHLEALLMEMHEKQDGLCTGLPCFNPLSDFLKIAYEVRSLRRISAINHSRSDVNVFAKRDIGGSWPAYDLVRPGSAIAYRDAKTRDWGNASDEIGSVYVHYLSFDPR